MKSFEELQLETRAVQLSFLMTDIATGNIFLDVARTTRDSETRARNVQHATVAYDTVARLGMRLIMTEQQGIEFDEKLDALKQRLVSMELPLQ